MKTGYRVGKIVGYEEHYLLVDATDLNNQCERCCKYNSDKGRCYEYNKDCLSNKYYYIISNKKRKLSSMYRTIDMRKLSESCGDYCIYRGDHCYNDHKDVCIIRLIEGSSVDSCIF